MFRPLTRLGQLLAVAALAPVLHAGQISDDLRADLSSLKPGETIHAIISMSEQFPVTSVDWDLHLKQVSRQERHEVVVTGLQDMAAATQADLKEMLKSYEGSPDLKSWQSFWITNAVHVEGSRALIEMLAQRSDVGQINKNYPIENERPIITPVAPGEDAERFMADGLAAVNAPAVWALGYTGAGTLVCNIDTGVDGGHSALSSRWRGNSAPAAECFYDPVQGASFPYDSGAHGTHTMGTITGMSTVTGDTTGVAFGAQWICAATIDHPGGGGINGTIVLALQSFQWAVDPDGNPGTLADVPDVISNSWGIPQGFLNQCDQTYWNAIDACEAAGSVVVFAAGNEGFSGLRSPSARATSIYSTFAVAALDISNPNAPFVAGFSSRGPSACSADPILQIKPEIAAPGVNTYSTVPGGGYESGWSGTSMATPHVAGVIALMRCANPTLDAITIKQIIMDTALDIDAPGNDNNAGHGMIDALACVLSSINGYGSVSGVVTGNGSPIPAIVSVQGGPQSVTCDINGNYSMGLPGDASYTMEYSYFGYVSGSANISIVGDGDVVQNMNLALAPSAVLSGTVFAPDASPVAGATVTVQNTPLAPVVTNGAGFYQITIPSGANYSVHAVGPGLGQQTQNVFVGGNTTLNFNLPSDPMFSPSPPDSYGYRIFDSNDGAGAPVYVWSSISGIGTQIFLSDDSYFLANTPFSFNFYGSTYNSVGIASNGYLSMGTGYSVYFNGSIPDGFDPSASVYGVWDDLNPGSGGNIWYMYSAAHGGFVVEYDGVYFYGTSTPLSFQIIVLDPGLYPTPSGDAAFLVHYLDGDRESSTIGIENPASSDGVQYVFDGNYAVTSSPIAGGGISLLITTNPNGIEQGEDTFAPIITHNPLPNTGDTAGPYTVSATIFDASGIAGATLEYRYNGGGWSSVAMSASGNTWTADIPGPSDFGDVIDYRIMAVDSSPNSNSATTPDYTFNVVNYVNAFCENFESGTLGDFTVETYDPSGNTWYNIYYDGIQGYTAYIQYSSFGQVDHAALISPPVDCSLLAIVDLTFWHNLLMGYGGSVTDAYVRISTDGGATFPTTVAEWHADNEPEEINITGIESFDISAVAAGQPDVRVMFEFYDIYDWYWYVDDVCINGSVANQGLDAPVVSISYTQVGNQVHMDWDDVDGADNYNVYSSTDGYGPWTLLATVANSNYSTAAVAGDRYYQVKAQSLAVTSASAVAQPDPMRNRVYREYPGKDTHVTPSTTRGLTPGVVSETYIK